MRVDEVFERLSPAVVGVRVGAEQGSGVVLDRRGLAVTNRHVVGVAREVVVQTASTFEHPARVLRSLRDLDLAFLRLPGGDYPAAVLAPPERLKVGIEVVAIGYPYGFANTVTRGIVSSVGRWLSGAHWIQTDAAINPGNSGGPLLDEAGEVVGINTMAVRDATGLGFAIPASVVRGPLEALLSGWDALDDERYCGVCGDRSPTAARWCARCGDDLEEGPDDPYPLASRPGRVSVPPAPMQIPGLSARTAPALEECPSCRLPIRPGTRYCPRCGTAARGS